MVHRRAVEAVGLALGVQLCAVCSSAVPTLAALSLLPFPRRRLDVAFLGVAPVDVVRVAASAGTVQLLGGGDPHPEVAVGFERSRWWGLALGVEVVAISSAGLRRGWPRLAAVEVAGAESRGMT
jgi:hypothetical protein